MAPRAAWALQGVAWACVSRGRVSRGAAAAPVYAAEPPGRRAGTLGGGLGTGGSCKGPGTVYPWQKEGGRAGSDLRTGRTRWLVADEALQLAPERAGLRHVAGSLAVLYGTLLHAIQ